VRAGKYLESSINTSRTVVLKASKGYVVSWNFAKFTISVESTRFFRHSFRMKTLTTYRMWSTFQLSTRTATTKATQDCLRLEDLCPPLSSETIAASGNSSLNLFCCGFFFYFDTWT
jgi:hypothetical protein